MAEFNLGKLPIVSSGSMGERESLAAFSKIIPNDRFCLRDERISDAGVDVSLEVLENSQFTNFREQVQIKSLVSSKLNQDGSISYKIEVSNLNYLLNGENGIYILYSLDTKTFRYTWAIDEKRRLDKEKPSWYTQDSVSLRFSKILDSEALNEIHERIFQEGLNRREILERLASASLSEIVTIHLDPKTLSCIKPNEVKETLLSSGLSIVTVGFPDEVLRMMGMLDSNEINNQPRLHLIKAYAEIMLARFMPALASIQEAEFQKGDLSKSDQLLLDRLKDICEYYTGMINLEELFQRDQGRKDVDPIHLFNILREQVNNDFEFNSRIEKYQKLIELGKMLLGESTLSPSIKLFVKLSLEYENALNVIIKITNNIATIATFSKLGFYEIDRLALLIGSIEKFSSEEILLESIVSESFELNNPILLADTVSQKTSIEIAALGMIFLWVRLLKLEQEFPIEKVLGIYSSMIERTMKRLATSREIYERASRVEGLMRVDLSMADILDLQGDNEGAARIAHSVLPKAKAMRNERLIKHATTIIDKRSPVAQMANFEFQKL